MIDGSEPPEFSSTVLTNRSVVEDGSLPLVIGVDINATDPNSSPGSAIGQYRVLTNGMMAMPQLSEMLLSHTSRMVILRGLIRSSLRSTIQPV